MENQIKKISIIVPVYNTEKYLKKCLDSIINQTYKNIEIIIINDGSTDNSQNIIEEYKLKYPEKINAFYKENGGLSSARNFGILKATGYYIAFVDSDDYLDINLFENLLPEMEKGIDLIKFKLIKTDEECKEIKKINGPIFIDKDGQEAFNTLVFKDILLEPACLYLYKKEFFIKNKFEFQLNRYNEDFGLIPLIILKAQKVSSTNVYGYFYQQTDNSITRNDYYEKTYKSAKDILYHYDTMKNIIATYEINEETRENIFTYYTNSILSRINKLDKKDKKNYALEIDRRKLVNNIKKKNFKGILKSIYYKILIRELI